MADRNARAARRNARRTTLFLNRRSIPALTALGLTLASGVPAQAADTTIDNTAETVIGTGGGTQASPWNIGGFLAVGDDNTGTLDISAGGAVNNTFGHIALGVGSGSVTVDGAGSSWVNSNLLNIGFFGTGTLTITNGGAVSNTNGLIGLNSVSSGTVTVDGTGSTWTNSTELNVGNSGTGSLTIANDGAVAVNGSGIVRVARNSGSAGTLNIGAAAGDAAAAAGTLDAAQLRFGGGTGTLVFNHTEDAYGFAADISGGGTINQLSGLTNLTGNSSGFSGTTNADGGALVITGQLGGSGGIIGSSVGTTGTVSVLGTGASWTTTTFRVGDQGAGSLTIAGGGTVDSGDAWIGNASSAIGTASVIGTGSGWAASNGFDIGRFGTGTLHILDGAAVTAGNDSFIGGRAGSDGTVNVSGDGSSFEMGSSDLFVGDEGIGALNVTDGGEVSTVASYIGDDSGSSGEVTVTGSGSRFTNSDVLAVGFEGTGTLSIANGGSVSNTDGFIGDATTSNGAVTVDGTGSTWTNSNNLSVGSFGIGELTIANGGAVSAAGGNGTARLGILSGSTGTLNIGAATGDTATGAGTLDAGSVIFGDGTGTLVFNHTDSDYEFDPTISGAATLNHLSGSTTFTGDSSGFSGTTTIAGGTLYVNDALGGTVDVSGGILGGNGTLGSVTIGSGGTLAPGNSIGTITVAGNLTLSSSSIYAVEVSPGAADMTIVTGTATITGTLTTSYSSGAYTSGTQYTLINSAGGLSGTFASVSATNQPYGIVADVSYDPNNVFLTLTQFLDSGEGQIYASGVTTAIADERLLRNAVLDHLFAPGDGMVLWGQGFGGYNKFDDGPTITHHHSGGIAGFDLPLDNGLRAGLAAAYTTASTSIPAHGGSADGDGGHVLAYASWTKGPVALRGGAALGWGSSDVTRSVSSVGETNRSNRSYRTEQIFADAGYGFRIAGASLEPYLGLEHVHASMDSFQETGGPLSSFSGAGADDSATFTTLGIRALGDGIPAGRFEVTPSLDLGWRHGFGLSRPRQSVTVDNTGLVYIFRGTPLAEDAIAVKLGADIVIAPSLRLHLGYDGFLSSHSRDNAVTGRLAWSF